MPTYEYQCKCGKHFEKFLPLAEYETPQNCTCGEIARRVISRPMINRDYEGYNCPVSGVWVEGRKAHEENLRKTGCRVSEAGEREDAARYRQKQEATFDKKIEATVEKELMTMPTEKVEKLAKELSLGVDTQIIRGTTNAA